jgi:hypothetical protein
MNILILLLSSVVLAGGIGLVIYLLFKSKWAKRKEFDATRDLFI